MLGAISEPYARHTALLHKDFRDIGVEMYCSAQLAKESAHCLHNGSSSPHRKVNAPLTLQVMNHGVDRWGVKRVAADEQRMEGEALPQEVVLHELGNIAIDALVRLHPDEIRRHL